MTPSNPPTQKPEQGSEEIIEQNKSRFPIIGIGASAGGLEALESFMGNVPDGSGMAFVIIQHLDPTHKGILAELLQRTTHMRVAQAKDHTRVEPGSVYVIPPNKDMSIMHGILHLLEPSEPRGMRLPIDFFLRALADDQQENAVGVILSGMGSDGRLGLGAIKGKAGVTFAQDPATAKFDSMPRSAIEAGVVDVIAPVEELPRRILAYLKHIPQVSNPEILDGHLSQSALEKVLILLRSKTGHDFSLYKKTTIYRRIERRMGLHQIDRIATYVRYLQENPQELELLFRELLIGVTSFFRDPEAWEQIRTEIMPSLLANTSNQVLRAWIPACSTGEEAYSMAMIFKEALDEIKPNENVTLQIFATDLDAHAIDKAREGIFPENIAADVSPRRLERFFNRVENGYQVAKTIREMIIFAPQNVIMDPPFTKLDIVSCRNLLIYLAPELQKKLLPLFHYSLNAGGMLFLGSAETIGSFQNLFVPLTGKNRLYRRLEPTPGLEPVEFPTAFVPGRFAMPARITGEPIANLQNQVEQLLFRKYAPSAVLATPSGDILYTSGRTGKFLEPAAGRANWNIFAMAREGLRYELAGSFQKALSSQEIVTIKRLVMTGDAGIKQVLDITIEPIKERNSLQGMLLIVFSELAPLPKNRGKHLVNNGNARTAELEMELESARLEVQGIREQVQSSAEELRSANEELQSTNEELQSTNEELTTSKEELQSMNEELHTVNKELQSRLDELSHTNNDMRNLLDSTNIATLFLDNNLCVRRFTSETGKITRLLPSDVGRPITDIASTLFYPELAEDARQVLRQLIRSEHQIQTPEGHWYTARILPYRTLENKIDGVVITYTDITAFKNLEAELRKKNQAG
jgi:two-component system CheB/CheR fusion protein